jgi:hypothetical protein
MFLDCYLVKLPHSLAQVLAAEVVVAQKGSPPFDPLFYCTILVCRDSSSDSNHLKLDREVI